MKKPDIKCYGNFENFWEFLKCIKDFYSVWEEDFKDEIVKEHRNIFIFKTDSDQLLLVFDRKGTVYNNVRFFDDYEAVFVINRLTLFGEESFENDEHDKIIYSKLREYLDNNEFERFIKMFLKGGYFNKYENILKGSLKSLYNDIEDDKPKDIELAVFESGDDCLSVLPIFDKILMEKERISGISNQISFLLKKIEMLLFCLLVNEKLKDKLTLSEKKEE